jgi:hypothetical protein
MFLENILTSLVHYWHRDGLGMGRYSPHDEKPGKKDLDMGAFSTGNDMGKASV